MAKLFQFEKYAPGRIPSFMQLYIGTNFDTLLLECLSLHCVMPKCTTVVQTENDLFDLEIQLNSPIKMIIFVPLE